ncbi:MAG: DUF2804 domain-containing protein [Clostridia bacterium]|nr:DUF2804 domain-containing protein [Clostridia bacterium]
MQHRITSSGFLHDETGRLTECGYATGLALKYDRARVKASGFRLKEWDYYYVGNDNFGIALTIADNGYMCMDSVSFLDFESKEQETASRMRFPGKRRGLPYTSREGDISVRGKDYEITFLNDGKKRQLYGHMDNFGGKKNILFDITLTDTPRDSMVIATPFAGKPLAFYYNQKINCMRAEGRVILNGQEYLFSPATSFGVLDWGRGVWTYDNTWYWGSASGIAEGKRFGFNIGYGFGDTSAASENMVFCDGIAHKLSQVRFNIPLRDGREDYLSPWTFTSDDGRFEMDFTPILDRSARIDLKLLLSDQHQVFGRYSGRAMLDDGTVVHVKELTGFAEKVHNKW